MMARQLLERVKRRNKDKTIKVPLSCEPNCGSSPNTKTYRDDTSRVGPFRCTIVDDWGIIEQRCGTRASRAWAVATVVERDDLVSWENLREVTCHVFRVPSVPAKAEHDLALCARAH